MPEDEVCMRWEQMLRHVRVIEERGLKLRKYRSEPHVSLGIMSWDISDVLWGYGLYRPQADYPSYDLFHMHHSLTYLSREDMNPQLTCSQRQWLHSSVGRASHRYREVTGSSPVEVLNFSQAFLRNCKNCDHNCEDHSSFDYNLGQNKMRNKTPLPPYQWWIRAQTKTRFFFSSLKWGEGGLKFFICFDRDWILDRIKWEIKPPSPHINDEFARKPKRAFFFIIEMGGGGTQIFHLFWPRL